MNYIKTSFPACAKNTKWELNATLTVRSQGSELTYEGISAYFNEY